MSGNFAEVYVALLVHIGNLFHIMQKSLIICSFSHYAHLRFDNFVSLLYSCVEQDVVSSTTGKAVGRADLRSERLVYLLGTATFCTTRRSMFLSLRRGFPNMNERKRGVVKWFN